MENFFAPWRLKYVKKIVTTQNENACFICDAVKADKKEEVKHLVVYKNNLGIAILNKYPYNNGHILIAPVRHIPDIDNLTEAEIISIFEILKKIKSTIKRTSKAEGFNIGVNLGKVAGAGLVGHFHIHLLPRWLGDTNFMPIIAKVKVINQYLEDTCKALRKELLK